ncbi:MAG: Rne/Rng family ribonuclease [Firmicutes bacterium]|nr:Rne/Rng family ribonuclease [Bacillota bacterium]
MSKKILINVGYKEKRVAVTENSRLVELYVERTLDKDAAFGSIYKGKVSNVLPGMDAAFINIGNEKNAFIHAGDIDHEKGGPKKIQKLIHPGQEILVQIKKEAMGSKGAKVTSSLTIPGRYLVLMPGENSIGISRRIEDDDERDRLKTIAEEIKPDNVGLIIRTAADGADSNKLKQDLDWLLEIWREIEKKAYKSKAPALLFSDDDMTFRVVRNLLGSDIEEIIVDSDQEAVKLREGLIDKDGKLKINISLYSGKEPMFLYYGIENEIDKALRHKIWLDCGGFLIFDQTEALAIIDVNTGKFTGKDSLKNTVLTTNLEAAEEIARQLRLRNIGGIIIIDFIDMENPADKEKVRQRLEECLKKDRTRTNILGFTALGLLEMTRQKTSHDLSTTLQKRCPECSGTGRILDEETISLSLVRDLKNSVLHSSSVEFIIKAHPKVIAKIKELVDDLEELQDRLKVKLRFEPTGESRLSEYQIFPV